jgi:hypothetical protein
MAMTPWKSFLAARRKPVFAPMRSASATTANFEKPWMVQDDLPERMPQIGRKMHKG